MRFHAGITDRDWFEHVLHFKVYKSQAPVIEQAIDTAALMLGSDKSSGDDLRGFSS